MRIRTCSKENGIKKGVIAAVCAMGMMAVFCSVAMAQEDEDASVNDAAAESTATEDSEVFSGYEDLPWGASLEEAKRKYTLYKSKYTEKKDKKLGLIEYRTYDRTIVASWTKKPLKTFTEFRFYKDALYSVIVAYDNLQDSDVKGLLDKLAEKYGAPSSTDSKNVSWIFPEADFMVVCYDDGRGTNGPYKCHIAYVQMSMGIEVENLKKGAGTSKSQTKMQL